MLNTLWFFCIILSPNEQPPGTWVCSLCVCVFVCVCVSECVCACMCVCVCVCVYKWLEIWHIMEKDISQWLFFRIHNMEYDIVITHQKSVMSYRARHTQDNNLTITLSTNQPINQLNHLPTNWQKKAGMSCWQTNRVSNQPRNQLTSNQSTNHLTSNQSTNQLTSNQSTNQLTSNQSTNWPPMNLPTDTQSINQPTNIKSISPSTSNQATNWHPVNQPTNIQSID